ncbi:MAG: DUF4037 domain-containing protein [Acidaminococcales bacterium]|jgi:hypothetical protein|nr:DUF4037 domain-containing protein [Acidaminococcales bacterium]
MLMKGLELARQYYENMGAKMIRDSFPSYQGRIAAGLAGEGSECFGFDDEISRDHDWGPSFCLWLADGDFAEIGAELQVRYEALDPAPLGQAKRKNTPEAAGRVGALRTSDFYRKFIGIAGAPVSLAQWRRLPEHLLAQATNGAVFHDPLGEFSSIRESLLEFYPEDVRVKKIAARAAAMAQTGQYNYPRCVRRNEPVAALAALSEFVGKSCSMIHLLNKRYTPFYKWMHRSILSLPRLRECYDLLRALCDNNFFAAAFGGNGLAREKMQETIEKICGCVLQELRGQSLTNLENDFLLDHCPAIMSHIENRELRASHVMID